MEESCVTIGNVEFNVRIENGDLYINNEYYRQLCWTPGAISLAIGDWLYGLPADRELED